MNKLSESKIKIIIVSGILLICVVFIILIINIGQKQKNPKKETIVFDNVTDYSTYFFVQKNINSFLAYLSKGSSDYVYNLLNGKYIEENNITLQNSLYDKKISNTNTTYNFRIENVKMYQLNKEDNIVLYDLNGDVYDNGYDIYKNMGSRRFILLIDYSNRTFNIYPIFKDISNNDIVSKLKVETIKNNNYNNLQTISVVTQNMMCNTYYYDLYSLMLSDKEKAVEIIQNIKDKKQIEKFIKDSKLFGSIVNCNTKGNEIGNKTYYVYDNNGNKYTFIEKGIMNYTVSITN